MSLRDEIQGLVEALDGKIPDHIHMLYLQLADAIDEAPSEGPILVMSKLMELERRICRVEDELFDLWRDNHDIHDELQWVDIHLATLLPGAYGLPDDEEDDEI